MKYFATYLKLRRTRTAPVRRERQNWQSLFVRLGESPMTRIAAVVVLIVSAIGYISASSELSTKGYEMNDVDRQVSALRDDVQRLQISIAQYRSLSRVESRIVALGLVPTDRISYVDLHTGGSVAQR